MRLKTIYLVLTLYVITPAKCHSLSKLQLSNASNIYKVEEDKSTNTVHFSYPKTNTPTLREIIYYHIIEKPFFGSHENDIEGPDFDDAARPFTNAHGMPDSTHQEDTDKNIIDKESSEKEDFVLNSDEILDNLDNSEVGEDKNDKTSKQSVLESVDVEENYEIATDNVKYHIKTVKKESREAGEPLRGEEEITNEDQGVVDANMNTTEQPAILEDEEIDSSEGDTGLTEMELILNEDSGVETVTEGLEELSIEETTEHLDVLVESTKPEEPRDEVKAVATTVKEIGDKTIDGIEINEPITLSSVPEEVKDNGTIKRAMGGTQVNAVEEVSNVNYTRNTELLMSKRTKLFGSPEQLKERALKMKNIMPSVKIREPEVKSRRKREATEDIPEGPTLPELDYITLPEYVRSLISTTEKSVPATKLMPNPKLVEESNDGLSTDMEDRLKHILNQIKPLLAKSDNAHSDNENGKEIKSDNDKIKNIFEGRTYGMNLNSGRGSVWNDIINDNGDHVHFGDSIPEDAQEHLNFYHDEAYSDEDDIRREIIKRIQEIFANTDKKDSIESTTKTIKDDGEVNTELPEAIVNRNKQERSDKDHEINDKKFEKPDETEAAIERDEEINHSPDEIVHKLKTDNDDSILFEDENSSNDNNRNENVRSDIDTPVEIPEGASDAEFMEKLRQGRTYGMNLTDDEGVVWNDLFTNPGIKINYGEESTDEQPNEDNKSEQLKPFDAATASVGDEDDIYVKVEKKKPSNKPKDDAIEAKSEQEAVDAEKTIGKNDKINPHIEDSKDIEAQTDDNEPEIRTESSVKTDIGLKNDKDHTDAELHTNTDSDVKEKFWKFMTEWTTAYTQLLTGFIDEKISNAISDFKTSLKPDSNTTDITENPEEIDMVAEKELDESIKNVDDEIIPVNNTNLLKRRKDKDNKKKVTETSKVNSTENSPSNENLPNITATTIYGNSVGNKKVTNIFVFLTERNASLNFVQDIIKDGDKIIGDDLKPSVEEKENTKEDLSANMEQSKQEFSTENKDNLPTESPNAEEVEDRKEISEELKKPTDPKTNKVVDETSNHEVNKTVDVEKPEITTASDKELVKEKEKVEEKENIKEDLSANMEQSKQEFSTENKDNVQTESPKAEEIEDRKEISGELKEPTDPKTNKVVDETSNHEINKTLDKDVEKPEITTASDKELVKEKESDDSKTDNIVNLPKPVKEDTATNTEEPKTNAVVIDTIINDNSTLIHEIANKTEVPEEMVQNQDITTNAEQSEAKTNIVLDERIIDINNKSSVDTQSEGNLVEVAANTETITKIDIENPNLNLTDVQVGSIDIEKDGVTTELLDKEATTDSIESATLV